jgi:hypothetical protein
VSAAQEQEIAALRTLVAKLADAAESGIVHGDGNHFDRCEQCEAVIAARAALGAVSPTPQDAPK